MCLGLRVGVCLYLVIWVWGCVFVLNNLGVRMCLGVCVSLVIWVWVCGCVWVCVSINLGVWACVSL